MAAIKFGTDGWRARIAEDFTFANVEVVTQALVDYLKTQNAGGELRTVVGYDRRFASELFARRKFWPAMASPSICLRATFRPRWSRSRSSGAGWTAAW